MSLSAERKQYILDLANDEWVARLHRDEPKREKEFKRLSVQMDKECEEFVNNTASCEELHEFARHFNWDKAHCLKSFLCNCKFCKEERGDAISYE